MSEKQAIVSVIVPIYNVSEYLKECIESILNQTYRCLEIILVDDGSIDDSLEICEHYAKTDSRIRIISQENQGVAKARKNAGMIAGGEYVFFVDADDYIVSDLLEELVDCAKGYDLITSGYLKGYGDTIRCFDVIASGAYKTHDEMNYIIDNMIMFQNGRHRGLTPYIWNKLYRTELVKETLREINENLVIGEDSEFLYRYILKCKSVLVTDVCGYFYRVREKSALNATNKKYLRSVSELYESLEEMFSEHERSEQLLFQLQRWISGMMMQATARMGFCKEAQNINYIFPFMNLLTDKDVVLYGAGWVGRDYYNQISRMNLCKKVTWIDQKWAIYRAEDMDVQSPEILKTIKYDCVIVAVSNQEVADSIKNELIAMGIDEDKLMWKEPYSIVV